MLENFFDPKISTKITPKISFMSDRCKLGNFGEERGNGANAAALITYFIKILITNWVKWGKYA